MTRDEAKALGLKRYSTGKPCLRGHIAERLVTTHSCCQCALEQQQTAESRAKHAAYYKYNRVEVAAKQKVQYQQNRERIAANKAAYYKASRSERLAQRAAYYKANRAEIAARSAAYAKANPHLYAARNAKRRAAKRQATPRWADLEAIKAIYEQAAFITRVTGEQNHVDHITPLQGKKVCGLHVAANLQILTASDNFHKSNKLLPMYEMPEPAVE